MRKKPLMLVCLLLTFSMNTYGQWAGIGENILYNLNPNARIGVNTDLPSESIEVYRGNILISPDTNDARVLSFNALNGGNTIFRSFTNRTNNRHFMDVDLLTVEDSSDAVIRFFRRTRTNGIKRVDFLRGNNTTNTSARINVSGGNSFFNRYGGNVGIGIQNPTAKLHIDGDLRLQSPNNNTFAMLVDNSGDLKFRGDGGVIALTIRDQNGNVGIGTQNPTARLHVSGGDNSAEIIIEADVNNNNSGEGNHPKMTLSQDGGRVKGEIGYYNSTNDMRIVNKSGGASIILKANGDIIIGN